ncbi:MAG TPA: hypothetical protein VFB80_15355 [Pirellulaceae bacterium]|nr:hypothetical protein [Pirellulaceae bacterium]
MAAQAILGAALGTAAIAVGRGIAAATGDGLSFAAELLKAAGGQPSEMDDNAGPDELTQRISALADRFRRHLAAAGIKLLEPVELISDGLGGIAVAGVHPQRAEIEEALAADLTLESEFNRLAVEYGEGLPSVVVSNEAQ